MNTATFNNGKLGLFVLAGSLLLIFLLYMIGKNKFMFGSNFILKARFENVQGLKSGNNIRFNGIEIGTVKSISIINDTCIEVNMIIGKKLKNINSFKKVLYDVVKEIHVKRFPYNNLFY